MKVDYTDPVVRLLIPRYNELALFLMSISFILIFFTYDQSQATIGEIFSDHYFDPRVYLLLIFFVLGLIFSLYHVFTERRKTDFEKYMMLFFAVFVNAFSGIAAGIHLLVDGHGILMLFPLWNITNGVLLIVMLRFDIIGEQNITDENATLFQVLLGLMILLLVFLVCHTVIELHWTLTFSICVGCSTNVSGIVQDSLSGSQSN